MQTGSMADPDYRNGTWGPAYLIQGPSSDMGVLLLGPGDSMPNHLHEHCDESFVVVLGHPRYYPRFGFHRAADHGQMDLQAYPDASADLHGSTIHRATRSSRGSAHEPRRRAPASVNRR